MAVARSVGKSVGARPMWIGGKRVVGSKDRVVDVIDPSTEEVIARVPDATPKEVGAAVTAARAAFPAWAAATPQERGRVLFRIAEKVRAEAAILVEAEFDINDVATCFEYYGGLATKVTGHVNPVPDNALSLSLKEPVGVAAQIIPWNYPLLMAAWKLAPALAAGCTCVLKPAEQTPLTALMLADWLPGLGVPDGVVNIITGLGETAGAALVNHPEVDKIAFTGSA